MSATLKLGTDGNWAAKKGSVLSYNDENGNFKPLPFTFDRSTSATRVNKEGLIEVVSNNEPRIDFLNDSDGALKLEPSRSNNLPYAEQFDNAAWSKGNSTVTANQAISPDGSQTADLLQLTSAGGNVYDNVGGSGDYAFSVFAKYVDAQFIRLRSTGSYAYFDIQNGSVGSTINVSSTKIEDYGNGWYRCTVVGNNTNSLAQIFVSDTDGSNTGTGSVYLWGAMFEEGSYPTSYIPTQGSIGTRVAETSLQVIPSDISLSTSGTVFLDYTLNIKLTAGHFPLSVIDYNNGSAGEWSSRGSFRFDINTNGSASYDFVLSGLVTSPTIVSNVFPNIGSRGKMAVSWDGTNVTFSVNGVNYQDTLSANFTGSLDGIYLGQLGTFNNTHKEGKFNEVKLYNTKLSNEELINLTKI